MPTHPAWTDIAWRLLLTAVAGTLFGINREEHGRPAGLRTTLLVALAAALSMIQVNLLLPVAGKPGDSFVVMDLMRLPLGILSGMGFIGAGAIIHRENLVSGVTTAATLWFVTVVGLCFGGGQLALGLVALGLGWVVLWLLKPIERWWKQDRQAHLTLVVGVNGATEAEVAAAALASGFRVGSLSVVHHSRTSRREFQCLVRWRGRPDDIQPPAFVRQLASRESTLKVAWQALAG